MCSCHFLIFLACWSPGEMICSYIFWVKSAVPSFQIWPHSFQIIVSKSAVIVSKSRGDPTKRFWRISGWCNFQQFDQSVWSDWLGVSKWPADRVRKQVGHVTNWIYTYFSLKPMESRRRGLLCIPMLTLKQNPGRCALWTALRSSGGTGIQKRDPLATSSQWAVVGTTNWIQPLELYS